jgi:hypothetical protein
VAAHAEAGFLRRLRRIHSPLRRIHCKDSFNVDCRLA